MNKKIIVPTVLFVFVLVFSFFALSHGKGNGKTQTAQITEATASQIILFVGDGCPHCADVESYIAQNKITDKVSFTEEEVYHNQDNAKELVEKASACGLSTNSIGIPFLWDGEGGGKCVVGEDDVIAFFKSKAS